MRPRPWRTLDVIETAFAILITVWIASVAVWATTRHSTTAQLSPRAVESARLP